MEQTTNTLHQVQEISLETLSKKIDVLIDLQKKDVRLRKISLIITVAIIVLPIIGSIIALPFLLQSVTDLYSGISAI